MSKYRAGTRSAVNNLQLLFGDVVGKFKSRRFGWIAVACGVMLISYMLSPPYSFHPFCTYDLTYRLRVTLEAEGKQYSSEVVRQQSRSRNWIETMNSGGCPSNTGTALAFRLGDNRLVLLSSNICLGAKRIFATGFKYSPVNGKPISYAEEAARAMWENRKVDVTSHCAGISRVKIVRWEPMHCLTVF